MRSDSLLFGQPMEVTTQRCFGIHLATRGLLNTILEMGVSSMQTLARSFLLRCRQAILSAMLLTAHFLTMLAVSSLRLGNPVHYRWTGSTSSLAGLVIQLVLSTRIMELAKLIYLLVARPTKPAYQTETPKNGSSRSISLQKLELLQALF